MSLCLILPIMNDCLREDRSFWTFAFGKAITHCVRCRVTIGSVPHLQPRVHHCWVACAAGRYDMMDSRWFFPFIADSQRWFSINDPPRLTTHPHHQSSRITCNYRCFYSPRGSTHSRWPTICIDVFIIAHHHSSSSDRQHHLHNASHLTLLSVPLTGCSSLIRFISL